MRPAVLEAIAATRDASVAAARSGKTVGLVPTMGALHEGHAHLIEKARRECDFLMVTIFVNPLQFDRTGDLERYPRTLEADLDLCGSIGVDAVFAPTAAVMYPTPPACTIHVGHLAEHLCGAHRPGHFDGVATVVLKLFEIAQPTRAYFGEKDAQQLAIIRRMVGDLNLPVTIVPVATVRESDGLAMSSRNRHLSPDERTQAITLFRALTAAATEIRQGKRTTQEIVRRALQEMPERDDVRVEYLEIVDPEELQPVVTVTGKVLVAGAFWVGRTRLIDNLVVTP